jgi:hypothetical protein
MREWDYSGDAKIALGVFYERRFPTFGERMAITPVPADEREKRIFDLLATRI